MKYSMKQVENLTGIKAHTLRIWERRYTFLNPERSDSNIRFYSEDQLKMLLNIDILIRNGFRISQIDQLSNDELNQKVFEILRQHSNDIQDEINALILCMMEMNESEFNQIIQRQILRKGMLGTISGMIYPFLRQVGVLWGISKTNPAQEHFITNLIRQKIIAAIDSLPNPPQNAPAIVMFLPEGEYHEIGLLLSSMIAKDLGWKVFYLGQSVPLENISEVLKLKRPALMMTMITIAGVHGLNEQLKLLMTQTKIPLLITGNNSTIESASDQDRMIPVSDPQHLMDILNNYKV